MEEKRISSFLEIDRNEPPMQPMLNHMFASPGDRGFEADGRRNLYLEAEKKEIILDMTQFILDLTGTVEPTPFSDGTNALISVARGNWIDAAISIVSIAPFVGDLAKVGKFSGYLRSIRRAIKIAETDGIWCLALRKLFTPLRKLVDQLIEVSKNKLPDELLAELYQIKDEIDRFMPSALKGGAAPGQVISKEARELILKKEAKGSATGVNPKGVGGGKGDDISISESKNVEVPDKVVRSDENFPSKTTKKGGEKAYTDKDGNLYPANPKGKTTIPEHLRNHKNKKGNSPHISTTAQDGNVKPRKYGDNTVEIDTKQLQKDIDAGKVNDVEIVPPKKVQEQVQKKIDNAQKKYNVNPTKKNLDTLNNAKRDLRNTTRDNECIITVTGKGCVPSEYIKKAK